MKKIFKVIPLFAMGIVAAGCAGTESEEPSVVKTSTAMRTSTVAYAAVDGTCEHDYEAMQIIAPTCTEQGYTIYTCSNCGDSYTDDFVAANGHATVHKQRRQFSYNY